MPDCREYCTCTLVGWVEAPPKTPKVHGRTCPGRGTPPVCAAATCLTADCSCHGELFRRSVCSGLVLTSFRFLFTVTSFRFFFTVTWFRFFFAVTLSVAQGFPPLVSADLLELDQLQSLYATTTTTAARGGREEDLEKGAHKESDKVGNCCARVVRRDGEQYALPLGT